MSASLVVLAAGMGSRYGGLKQLDGFGPENKTILEYSLYDAINAGFDTIIFIIRSTFQQDFIDKIVVNIPNHVHIVLVDQQIQSYLPVGYNNIDRIKPRGTGHALLCAKEYLDKPFAVINADDYYGQSGFKLMYKQLTHSFQQGESFMIGYILSQTLSPHGSVNRGVCTLEAGFLQSIKEYVGIEKVNGQLISQDGKVFCGEEIVSMNFLGFEPTYMKLLENQFLEFLEDIGYDLKKEFYLPSSCNNLIASGDLTCKVDISPDVWCGVTYQDDKHYVDQVISKFLLNGLYPKNLYYQE